MHYKLAFEQHETPSSPEATALLNSSAHYLHLRARIEDSGSAEERWWAAVMLGQLFLYDTDKKVRTGFGHAALLLRGWSLHREDFGHSLFCRSKRKLISLSSSSSLPVLSIKTVSTVILPRTAYLRTNSLIR